VEPSKPAARPTPAPLFFLLLLPFGVVVGYSQYTTPYLLDKLGLLALVATAAQQTGGLPHTIKIFWAPALDTRGLRKTWYVYSLVLAAIAQAATVFVDAKAALGLYTVVLFAANVGVATASSAADALMATTVPKERKGAAAGWSMAGNLGGTGVGGSLGLFLTEHTPRAVTAAVLAATILLCGLPILWIDEPARPPQPVLRAVGGLAKDLYRTAISRVGWTGLLICLSPVGAGAAANLFAGGMHNDYHASESTVEIVNGLLGGIVAAVGCLVGGYLADRMNRRLAYAMAGAMMALVAIGMAFGPLTQGAYCIGTLSYQLANSIGYSAFVAFVLELVGEEGAVTTKYTLYVAAANLAISYTAVLDGWGYDRGRVRGLFLTDAGATIAGIAVLLGMTVLVRRRPAAAVPA
jgi:PAT family beta-lactamase induction signal transducer AmpG